MFNFLGVIKMKNQIVAILEQLADIFNKKAGEIKIMDKNQFRAEIVFFIFFLMVFLYISCILIFVSMEGKIATIIGIVIAILLRRFIRNLVK